MCWKKYVLGHFRFFNTLYIYPDSAFVAPKGGALALISSAAIPFVCSSPFRCPRVKLFRIAGKRQFWCLWVRTSENVGETRHRTQGVLCCSLVPQLGKEQRSQIFPLPSGRKVSTLFFGTKNHVLCLSKRPQSEPKHFCPCFTVILFPGTAHFSVTL